MGCLDDNGRRRYITELSSKIMRVRSVGERMAINTPVQGSAADIIKKAFVDLSRVFADYNDDVRILLQIHDEIICEVKESLIEEIRGIIIDKMEHAFTLDVPLRVTTKVGKNWLEMS